MSEQRKEAYDDPNIADRSELIQASLCDLRTNIIAELDEIWEEEVQSPYACLRVIEDEMGDEIEDRSDTEFRKEFVKHITPDEFISRLVESKYFRRSIKDLIESYAQDTDIPTYLVDDAGYRRGF